MLIETNVTGLSAVIIAVVSGFGGYFTAYLKKGAEIRSMSDNIKELVAQQRKITEATESVKHDIEHEVWRKKEQELIRRQKMEEFALLCLDLPQYLSDEFVKRTTDANAQYDRNYYKKFLLIQRLYLPRFEEEMGKLITLYEQYEKLVSNIEQNKPASSSYLQSRLPEFHEVRRKIELLSAKIVSKAGDEIENMGHV
ncbi:hypothetical protein [Vibrio alginolyticus]|uniref:hypothetical protein n=1 Tax=Vibrio alginolyticus TaxID=663 RepID=UPI001EC3E8A4|nr:hypothetical protein [Vibrio alginolyticus]EGR0722489.1 hypothetical protein [Vibrio alginolyticus]EJU9973499.1 hypothetical protein [Vibrio alginolyticus]MCR9535569.1 hypothetical protein [Vibrio alginolyticus]HCG5104983.1 hypothetical protein [Vibrio parahaemolyticus]